MNNIVSVLVLTYSSKLDKIIMTLRSILTQVNCMFQIVVSDDGSQNNYFHEIENFFHENKFNNYLLVENKQNQGTVKNVLSGMSVCKGKYVKLISPGDCLANGSVLQNWVKQISETNSVVSFCDAIYYSVENDVIKIRSEKAHPQDFHKWKVDLKRFYLLYDDIGLGAASLCETEILKEYLEMLEDKVTFAEDNVYRLMSACDEKFSFYNQPCVFYEYGVGISTGDNRVWSRNLSQDWAATDLIILNSSKVDSATKHWLRRKEKVRNSCRFLDKIWLYLSEPRHIVFRLKVKLNPRMTAVDTDVSYLRSLAGEM